VNLIEDILAAPHAEMDRFHGFHIEYGFDEQGKQKAKSSPFVLWYTKGGATKSLDQKQQGFLFSSVTRLDVSVWGPSDDYALPLFLNLQLACHRCFAQKMTWGNHTVELPNGAYRGSIITCTAELVIDMSDQPLSLPDRSAPLDDYADRVVLTTTLT
jgi:hypothetical protein